MARMLAQGQLLTDYKTHLANPVPLPHTGAGSSSRIRPKRNLPGFCSSYDRLHEKFQEYGDSCVELCRKLACRNALPRTRLRKGRTPPV